MTAKRVRGIIVAGAGTLQYCMNLVRTRHLHCELANVHWRYRVAKCPEGHTAPGGHHA